MTLNTIKMSKTKWILASGTIFGVENAFIFEKCKKKDVGKHIKKSVKKLFNHFIVMSQCDDSGGNIWKFIRKYIEINDSSDEELDLIDLSDKKLDLSDLSDEELIKVTNDITNELKKYSDEKLVDEFVAYGDGKDGYFVNISKLSKPAYDMF